MRQGLKQLNPFLTEFVVVPRYVDILLRTKDYKNFSIKIILLLTPFLKIKRYTPSKIGPTHKISCRG